METMTDNEKLELCKKLKTATINLFSKKITETGLSNVFIIYGNKMVNL